MNDLTDAQLSLAEDIAKHWKEDAFPVDRYFLLQVIQEVRAWRKIAALDNN